MVDMECSEAFIIMENKGASPRGPFPASMFHQWKTCNIEKAGSVHGLGDEANIQFLFTIYVSESDVASYSHTFPII